MSNRFLRSCAVTVLVISFVATVLAKDFSGTFSLSNSGAQRLSSWLISNGYTGSDATMSLDLLTVCNPAGNGVDLYVGQANVSSSNGFVLEPGTCYTWAPGSRATDANSIYLRVYTTQTVGVSLRSR